MARSRRWQGYTLIELLLVLVIISVAAALAAPSISRGLDGFKARSALRSLLAGLAEARVRAIRAGSVHYAEAEGGRLSISSSGAVVRQLSLPRCAELSASAPAAFYPSGTAGAAAFEIRCGAVSHTVVLDGSGRARVLKEGG